MTQPNINFLPDYLINKIKDYAFLNRLLVEFKENELPYPLTEEYFMERCQHISKWGVDPISKSDAGLFLQNSNNLINSYLTQKPMRENLAYFYCNCGENGFCETTGLIIPPVITNQDYTQEFIPDLYLIITFIKTVNP